MSTVALLSAPASANLDNAAPEAPASARHDGPRKAELEAAGVMRLSLFGSSIEIGEIKGIALFSILGC